MPKLSARGQKHTSIHIRRNTSTESQTCIYPMERQYESHVMISWHLRYWSVSDDFTPSNYEELRNKLHLYFIGFSRCHAEVSLLITLSLGFNSTSLVPDRSHGTSLHMVNGSQKPTPSGVTSRSYSTNLHLANLRKAELGQSRSLRIWNAVKALVLTSTYHSTGLFKDNEYPPVGCRPDPRVLPPRVCTVNKESSQWGNLNPRTRSAALTFPTSCAPTQNPAIWIRKIESCIFAFPDSSAYDFGSSDSTSSLVDQPPLPTSRFFEKAVVLYPSSKRMDYNNQPLGPSFTLPMTAVYRISPRCMAVRGIQTTHASEESLFCRLAAHHTI
ncbi:hypothetical protein DFP72DRAFT_847488 [Ephemerocybe angulata]|uniref:Uncharacterized protein n=1 Tax=Ephemerocybe angulata TaxID=980116 RepID=A0A8H6M717_9AGAR|nr:hypothetical protein DFP72DRAFT_847488 [Tulosesus angulatus]